MPHMWLFPFSQLNLNGPFCQNAYKLEPVSFVCIFFIFNISPIHINIAVLFRNVRNYVVDVLYNVVDVSASGKMARFVGHEAVRKQIRHLCYNVMDYLFCTAFSFFVSKKTHLLLKM